MIDGWQRRRFTPRWVRKLDVGFSFERVGLPELVFGAHLDGYILWVEFVTYAGCPLASATDRERALSDLTLDHVFDADELLALRNYWLALYE